jgi:hypothetical protein
MGQSKVWCIFSALLSAGIAVMCMFCITASRAAEFSDFISVKDPVDTSALSNSIVGFYGRLSTTNLGSTFFFNTVPLFTTAITGQRYDNFIAGLTYQRDFLRYQGLVIAAEVGVADRFGHYKNCCAPDLVVYSSSYVDSGEFWFGPSLRYESIILFNTLRVVPGFTFGFSAVTNSIGTEHDRELDLGGNATLLGYLGFDLNFSLVDLPQWEFVLEEHHRSGANKLLGHMMEGYNANVAGVRYRF